MKFLREYFERRDAALEDDDGQSGFTLIELMVVSIIIGILAAIAIPQFIDQRQSAWESETKSDVVNFEIAAASYSLKNDGAYGTSSTTMTTSDLTGSPYNFAPSVDDPLDKWTLSVSDDKKSYTVTAYNKNFSSPTGHLVTFDSSTGKLTVG